MTHARRLRRRFIPGTHVIERKADRYGRKSRAVVTFKGYDPSFNTEVIGENYFTRVRRGWIRVKVTERTLTTCGKRSRVAWKVTRADGGKDLEPRRASALHMRPGCCIDSGRLFCAKHKAEVQEYIRSAVAAMPPAPRPSMFSSGLLPPETGLIPAGVYTYRASAGESGVQITVIDDPYRPVSPEVRARAAAAVEAWYNNPSRLAGVTGVSWPDPPEAPPGACRECADTGIGGSGPTVFCTCPAGVKARGQLF